MKKFLKLFAIAALFIVFVASCEEEDKSYNGPLQIEFPSYGENIGGYGDDGQWLMLADVDSANAEIKVQLIGAQLTEPITFEFEVIHSGAELIRGANNEDTTVCDAVLGTDFQIGTTATFAANSSEARIPFTVLTPDNVTKYFGIILKSNDKVEAAANLKELLVKMKL